jgi:serine O-acetyltransferase
MIACDSCFDTNGCALDSLLGRPDARRDRYFTRFFGDPLWNSIRAEALVEADREPLLRPLLERAVLHRNSFGEGLATVLSERLCKQALDLVKFDKELRDVIANDSTIIESARNDLKVIQANDPATTSLLHPLLNFKGFLAIQAHRIAHSLWTRDRRALAYHIQSRVSEVFGVDIHPAATIGSGVFIDHATGVVIGETAVVGDDVTMLHGVTLGGTGKESGDRHPKVGRGVYIGANAQLLGNIAIGEGSRIGASSVVLKSVEAYSTVAGVPAQVVRHERRPTNSGRGAAELMAVSTDT